MNYIYDIYLNFNKELYDFFDWNKNDKILKIKKIPILKIDNKSLKECINNKIKIENALLNNIKYKTECSNSKLKNALILSDGSDMIALEFDNKGICISKSSLQINDELDILESIEDEKKNIFKFEILFKDKINFKTRKQTKLEKIIFKEIKKMENSELEYISKECLNKKIIRANDFIELIKNDPNKNRIYNKIINILELTSTNKKKML